MLTPRQIYWPEIKHFTFFTIPENLRKSVTFPDCPTECVTQPQRRYFRQWYRPISYHRRQEVGYVRNYIHRCGIWMIRTGGEFHSHPDAHWHASVVDDVQRRHLIALLSQNEKQLKQRRTFYLKNRKLLRYLHKYIIYICIW